MGVRGCGWMVGLRLGLGEVAVWVEVGFGWLWFRDWCGVVWRRGLCCGVSCVPRKWCVLFLFLFYFLGFWAWLWEYVGGYRGDFIGALVVK